MNNCSASWLLRGFYGALIGAMFGIYCLFSALASKDPMMWYTLFFGWFGGILNSASSDLFAVPILFLPVYVVYGFVAGMSWRVAAIIIAVMHYVSVYVALSAEVSEIDTLFVDVKDIYREFLDKNSPGSIILNLVPFVVANALFFYGAFSGKKQVF